MFFIKSKLIALIVIIHVFYYRKKANKHEKKIIDACKNYEFSTTTEIHLWHILSLFKKINKKIIIEDFVECGVWKGIYLVFFQKLIEHYNLKNSSIYAFDTYEGMPEPSSLDIAMDGKKMHERYENLKLGENTSSWNNTSLNDVEKNYFQNTLSNKNLISIKGMVENTLVEKKNIPKKISVLKLDTCLYDGTKIELEVLFPRVHSGGLVIIDNYSNFKGVKRAVQEFFANDNDNIIEYHAILGRVVVIKK
tara:strand:+ start:7652 stop:8401 length:750 start_codon:yes stop_codon:yes gene_type:complete